MKSPKKFLDMDLEEVRLCREAKKKKKGKTVRERHHHTSIISLNENQCHSSASVTKGATSAGQGEGLTSPHINKLDFGLHRSSGDVGLESR